MKLQFPETVGVPGQYNQPQVPGVDINWRPTAQLANALGDTVATVAGVEARKKKLAIEQDASSVATWTQLESARQTQDLQLTEKDPTQFQAGYEAIVYNTTQEAYKRLQHPESKALLDQHLQAPMAAQRLKAYGHSNDLYVNQVETKFDQQLADVQVLASAATTDAELQMQLGIAQKSGDTAAQVLGPQKVNDKLAQMSKSVQIMRTKRFAANEEADARLRFADETDRLNVMRDLSRGDVYRYIPRDDQLKLIDDMVAKQNARDDNARKRTKQINDDKADQAQRDIVDEVRGGNYAKANTILAGSGDLMTGENKRAWGEYIDKHAKAPVESDGATRQRLAILVYEAATPAEVEVANDQVVKAMGDGKLGAPHDTQFLNELSGKRISMRNRGQDLALTAYQKEHAEVKEELKEDLRVSGPMTTFLTNVTGNAQQTYAMALEDLHRTAPSAGPLQGGERPRAWMKRTRAEWIGRVGAAGKARIRQLEDGLKFTDELQARENKHLYESDQEYYKQIRRIRDASQIREEMKIMGVKPVDFEPTTHQAEGAGGGAATPSTPTPTPTGPGGGGFGMK